MLGGADLSAAALVVGPWLKKHPHVRLPVASYGGLNAYKADKTESYGTPQSTFSLGSDGEICC